MLSLRQLRMENQRACRPTGAIRPFLLADARGPGHHRRSGGHAGRGAALAFLDESHVRRAAECGGEDGDGDAGAGEREGEAACGGYHEECRCEG